MGCFESRPAQLKLEHSISSRNMINFKYKPITEFYRIEAECSEKGQGYEVKKVIHKVTGQIQAVKIIPRTQMDDESLRKEISIIRNLNHPNLLKVNEIFQDTDHFYLVSELLSGKELFEQIQEQGRMNEVTAAIIMKQLLSAVNYLHKHSVVHLAIKPENICFESGEENALIKLTNFESAKIFRYDDPLRNFDGTPEYMAPEMIEGVFNNSVDVWACGVTLYMLLSGNLPFSGSTKKDTFALITQNKLNFEEKNWQEVSAEAKDLLRKMLDKRVSQRISAEAALQHPWFKVKLSENPLDQANIKNTLQKLKTFRITNKIQSAVWIFMTNYVACKEEKDKLLDVFKALDADGDGQLSKEEVKNGFQRFSGSTNNNVIDNIFAQIDKNRSDFIDYNEFVTSVIDKKMVLSKENLELTFKLLDIDNSGSISITELQQAFGADTIMFDDDYWSRLIQEADKNGDGEIQFNEFTDLMIALKA